MHVDQVPPVIQGGMGVAVSSWPLARAVSQDGGLGVVSGTALDVVLGRRLQLGDRCGSLRRALAASPLPDVARRVRDRYLRPGGKRPDEPFARTPMPDVKMSRDALELLVTAAFVEVFLAKEGHDGPIGINLLEKIQEPTLATLYGAMLAGVDVVLVGAGIPLQIPGMLDRFARGEAARHRIRVSGDGPDNEVLQVLDPSALGLAAPRPLRRPVFLAIVSSPTVARTLARRATGEVDGFVVEAHLAGGHNAPPRRAAGAEGEGPRFGPRDELDIEAVRKLGRPFWIAGASASPEALRAALDAGARGVQVGSAFALCNESGMLPEIRDEILQRHHARTLSIRTDFDASPTGYPFKVVELPRTTADADALGARPRVCDLGYLREAYRTADGALGHRCPGEPRRAFVQKGGDVTACEAKQCLCNGLAATVGLGQVRAGRSELPTVTLGSDLSFLDRVPRSASGNYSACDVLAHVRG